MNANSRIHLCFPRVSNVFSPPRSSTQEQILQNKYGYRDVFPQKHYDAPVRISTKF